MARDLRPSTRSLRPTCNCGGDGSIDRLVADGGTVRDDLPRSQRSDLLPGPSGNGRVLMRGLLAKGVGQGRANHLVQRIGDWCGRVHVPALPRRHDSRSELVSRLPPARGQMGNPFDDFGLHDVSRRRCHVGCLFLHLPRQRGKCGAILAGVEKPLGTAAGQVVAILGQLPRYRRAAVCDHAGPVLAICRLGKLLPGASQGHPRRPARRRRGGNV